MWQTIKNIIKDGKTKCVIIEDGKPEFVIIPFAEYQHLQGVKGGSILKQDSANKEWEEAAESLNDYSSSVNIEDLPF